MGGLGNQMFQYALGQSLEQYGKDVKYDISFFDSFDPETSMREFALDVFLDDRINIADPEELSYNSKNFFTRKLLKKYFPKIIIEDESRYMEELVSVDNRKLVGYWQNENYFKNAAKMVRESFCFNSQYEKINQNLVRKIRETNNSVSLHIRGTDYIKFSDIYGGICTRKYYQRAIDSITSKCSDAYFFVFTDDFEYSKTIMDELDIGNNWMNVNGYDGKDSWIDMYYMSLCKHHIIANSSFSWWGAWLGEVEDSIIIGPNQWNNNSVCNNVMPQRWVRI